MFKKIKHFCSILRHIFEQITNFIFDLNIEVIFFGFSQQQNAKERSVLTAERPRLLCGEETRTENLFATLADSITNFTT